MHKMEIPFHQLGKAGYNRGINRAWVNKIKREYHADMEQPAIVSLRDGKYWIVDGQHRSQAKYELNGNDPNTLIACDVRYGLTYEQEADLYYRCNTGRLKPTFKDGLIGRIEAREKVALEFQEIIESCGYMIDGAKSTRISSLSTAYKIFSSRDGKKQLRQILLLTRACWPNNPSATNITVLNGMQAFIKNHSGEINTEHFIGKLSAVDPKVLSENVTNQYKASMFKSDTKKFIAYRLILEHYNQNVRHKLALVSPKG